MNKLFTWDELDSTITEREPADLFYCNAEGGWNSEYFLTGPEGDEDPKDSPPSVWYKYGEPAVEVRTNGRHVALETWCETIEEAARRFAWNKVFRDQMND